MNRRGYTLAELLIVIVLSALLGFFLVASTSRAIVYRKEDKCANNLAQLWKMQWNYSIQYGGPARRMPEETGTEFWLRLTHPPTVMMDISSQDILQCPCTSSDADCDYRGPLGNVNDLHDSGVVGSDEVTNHGSRKYNVLFKSGDVRAVEADDPLGLYAAATTRRGQSRLRFRRRP